MIRHISVFFLKKEDKEANLAAMKERLMYLGEELSRVKAYHVAEHAGEKPDADIPGVPEFGDLAQIIDFADAEAAAAYPHSPAHMALAAACGEYIERVVAMDIEMEERE